MWKYCEICYVGIIVYIKEKKRTEGWKKKNAQCRWTMNERWFNTECTVLNHCSGIAWKYCEIYCVSVTIYIKGKKSTNGRLEKNVATVATEPLGIVAIVQKRKKKDKVAHQNDTVDEQCKNTKWTLLKYCSGIAAFHKTFIFKCGWSQFYILLFYFGL